MRYNDLVFDLYGTLVDIHTEENNLTWEKTALYFGYYGVAITGVELRFAFEQETSRKEALAGQGYEMFPDIPFDEVLAELFRHHGIGDQASMLGFNAAQVFRIASTEYIRLYGGVKEALAALKAKGYRLWLLSNAQRAFTAYELRLLGLEEFFDGIYLSSDYHCRKPDLRFFRALLDDQRIDPTHCLMIGNDLDTDIAGAKNAGLSTLYMHTNLTPSDQRAAKTGRLPCSSLRRKHFEYEGSDWPKLVKLLLNL